MADVDGQEEMFAGATVSKLEDGDILASLSAWARCFGTSRETLQARLVEASVTSKGERSGFPVYGGREVFRAWISGPDSPMDPEALPQFQKRAYWQAENEKLTLQQRRGEVVPAIEVEQGYGKMMKLFVLCLETLPDRLERDVGLTPMQATKLERLIDIEREMLVMSIAGTPESTEPDQAPAKKPKATVPATPATSVLEEAVAFLQKALARGPKATAKLLAAAKKVGISEGTLRRAKAQLGKQIVARREGPGWVWSSAAKAIKAKKAGKARKTRKRPKG